MSYSDKLNLIHKHLTGELSTDEKANFATWKEEDKQNEVLANQIEKIWSTALNVPIIDFDAENAYQKHLNRIQQETVNTLVDVVPEIGKKEAVVKHLTQTKGKNGFNLTWVRVIAASMVLLIAVIFIFDNSSNSSNTYTAAVNALKDGSTVWLGSGSEMTTLEFKDNKREVRLNGKGYFDIATNVKVPFKIKTKDFDVEVLGTQFVINTEINEVIVREGKVKISNSRGEKILIANQKVMVSENKEFVLTNEIFMASDLWFNEALKFNNAPFDHVIRDLSINYNVKFILPANTDWTQCTFTSGSLKGSTLDQILVILKLTYDLEYTRMKDNNIKLSKVKCK